MPHVPAQGFCATCGFEIATVTQGLMLETVAKIGSYYKIAADLCSCPEGCTRYYRLAQQPASEHFKPGYESLRTDAKVFFREMWEAPAVPASES